MKLRSDRLCAGLLMLAAALQASYVVLSQSLRLTPVMVLATAVIGGFGLCRVMISRKPCELMLLTAIIVYFGLLAMCFSGRSLPDFLTNPLSLILFILLAAVIPQMSPVILQWRHGVAWMAMVVAVIHLSFIATHGIDVLTLLGGASLARYGSVDRLNLVNVTGVNIGLFICGCHFYLRGWAGRDRDRLIAMAAIIALSLPLFATGSRSSWLIVMAGLLAFEVSNLRANARSVLVPAGVVLAVASAVMLAAWMPADSMIGGLWRYFLQRMDLLGGNHDSLRAEAFRIALGIDGFMFGSGVNAFQVFAAARDLSMANYVISYGFAGFVLMTAGYLVTIVVLQRRTGCPLMMVALVPLVFRGMAEGTYMPTSILFSYIFFLISAALARQNMR